MSEDTTIAVLNALLALQYRSLPMFLRGAAPWTHYGDEKAAQALENIIADQDAMAQRLADRVLGQGGRVDPGEYPMVFTDLHDLALEYLLGPMLEHQRRDVEAIGRCVADLADDPDSRALAEEVLGSERAHLEWLEELVQTPV